MSDELKLVSVAVCNDTRGQDTRMYPATMISVNGQLRNAPFCDGHGLGEHMLMGQVHEHMLIGQAHRHMLTGQHHEISMSNFGAHVRGRFELGHQHDGIKKVGLDVLGDTSAFG